MCYISLTAVFAEALEKQPLDKLFCKLLTAITPQKKGYLKGTYCVLSGVHTITISMLKVSL